MHIENVYGARAWIGFDWVTMNRIHSKGYIGDPVSKAISVFVTPEGSKKAEELFNLYFIH